MLIAREPSEIHARFAEAFFARNADAVLALYADDAVMIPGPGRAPVQGHPAIRAAVVELLAMQPRDGAIETMSCAEAGGFALLRSRWKFTANGPAGAPLSLEGNGLELVKRMPEGHWVQVYDDPWGGGDDAHVRDQDP
jgi:ketosteroid isomerase-like protein